MQTSPILGDFNRNIIQAEKLFKCISPGSLVVLPELALTGYEFDNCKDIQPFLEPGSTGPSTIWAKRMAIKHKCFVAIGYPEIKANKRYNSVVLVDSKGNELLHYRKTHLYQTDKAWGCSANPNGFASVFGPWPQLPLRIQVGICMDLNPYEFTAPWDAYEFARAVAKNGPQLVLCPMAWISQGDEQDKTLPTYWQARLPLDNIVAVFANRTGQEKTTIYAGQSSIMEFGKMHQSNSREPIVYQREIII